MTGAMAQRVTLTKEAAEADFRAAWPEYEKTAALDSLRAREYTRLEAEDHIYLDYTAGGLYAASQLREHLALLSRCVLGNPHSSSPTSLATTDMVQHTREAILEFFNASLDEYLAIFTLNASGALKLVGESYPFRPGAVYALTFDNHNSVNGIREFARARGAEVRYVPIRPPELRVDAARLAAVLEDAPGDAPHLFAYPAQSNFSGVQHALEWIDRAHAHGWDVILDAAAFVPTNRLDLSRWHPDFVPVSFYKMFGYPTGVGCLIARKAALEKLHRPWFAGGTISVASVQGDRYYLAEGPAAFEDGTLDYLSIPAAQIGLRHLSGIGIETIHTRVMCLAGWLLDQLVALRHPTGVRLVNIYGPTDTGERGGTIAMNFYGPEGDYVDHRLIEQLANRANISLRTGCFCNPGEGEVALGLSKDELLTCFPRSSDHYTLDEFRRCIDTKSTGAVRVSVGLASNFDDVWRFAEFARGLVATQP
jgi:selenocysteine lyase/cysteine desulfurase